MEFKDNEPNNMFKDARLMLDLIPENWNEHKHLPPGWSIRELAPNSEDERRWAEFVHTSDEYEISGKPDKEG